MALARENEEGTTEEGEEAMKKDTKTNQPEPKPEPLHVCPCCGYCPLCGRPRQVEYVPYPITLPTPVYPWPLYPWDPPQGPIWISTTGITTNASTP